MSKKWFGKFIDKLAKANEKEYGNKVNDCCERNDIKNKNKN